MVAWEDHCERDYGWGINLGTVGYTRYAVNAPQLFLDVFLNFFARKHDEVHLSAR